MKTLFATAIAAAALAAAPALAQTSAVTETTTVETVPVNDDDGGFPWGLLGLLGLAGLLGRKRDTVHHTSTTHAPGGIDNNPNTRR